MNPIRRIRAERGMTQEQLAERSGVARETISRLERGAPNVRQSTLTALAYALDLEDPRTLES